MQAVIHDQHAQFLKLVKLILYHIWCWLIITESSTDILIPVALHLFDFVLFKCHSFTASKDSQRILLKYFLLSLIICWLLCCQCVICQSSTSLCDPAIVIHPVQALEDALLQVVKDFWLCLLLPPFCFNWFLWNFTSDSSESFLHSTYRSAFDVLIKFTTLYLCLLSLQ